MIHAASLLRAKSKLSSVAMSHAGSALQATTTAACSVCTTAAHVHHHCPRHLFSMQLQLHTCRCSTTVC